MMTARRTAIIAGNWKMNYGPRMAANFTMELMSQLGPLVTENHEVLCILCPPAISLLTVHEVLDAGLYEHIELGAQNMYYEEKGAFTGELAPSMVRELCTSVILGHSERRTLFGETDAMVNRKTLAALSGDLRPIVCIGERLEEYEAGQTEQVIHTQVSKSLANIPLAEAGKVVIAYEPIWAIGTGRAATADGAGQVTHLIRSLYTEMYGAQAGESLRILYGGSVTGANIAEFMAQPDIDGALVGGASLKPDFVEIVSQTLQVVKQ